jgi:hypothetical protein
LAPPLLLTRLTQVRNGAGIASSLGNTTLVMLAKGEGLQGWATPTSPRMLRRTKASSMLIPHSPASSRAASRQAFRMASGYSTAVPWAIQASFVSLTGHSAASNGPPDNRCPDIVLPSITNRRTGGSCTSCEYSELIVPATVRTCHGPTNEQILRAFREAPSASARGAPMVEAT